jgi:hypothetical protein
MKIAYVNMTWKQTLRNLHKFLISIGPHVLGFQTFMSCPKVLMSSWPLNFHVLLFGPYF